PLGVGGNTAMMSTDFEESRLLVSVVHALLAVGAVSSLMVTPGCCFLNNASSFWVACTAGGLVHSSMTSVLPPAEEELTEPEPPAPHPTVVTAVTATTATATTIAGGDRRCPDTLDFLAGLGTGGACHLK